MSMGMSCLSVSLKVVLWPTNIEVWIEDGFSRLPGHRLSPLQADYAVASVRASLNAVIWPSPLYVYLSVSLSMSLSASAPLCGSLAFCVIRMFFYSDFYTNRHIGLHTCRSLLSLLTVILYACILENGYPNRMRYSHRYRDKCIIIIVVIIIDDNYNNIIMMPVILFAMGANG